LSGEAGSGEKIGKPPNCEAGRLLKGLTAFESIDAFESVKQS
jgi:hypothetical protein